MPTSADCGPEHPKAPEPAALPCARVVGRGAGGGTQTGFAGSTGEQPGPTGLLGTDT